MSDTPRTPIQDRIASMMHAFDDEGRRYAVRLLAQDVGDLERELTAAQAEALKLQEENAKLQERIRSLEEGGDKAVRNSYFPDRLAVWNEAKYTQ